MSLPERFLERVVIGDGTCWQWTGPKQPRGYGICGRRGLAHRVSYEELVGPIPEGAVLDHLCRNTSCVNPQHLEPVSQRTNIHRGTAPAAENARKDECLRGHPLSGDNLFFTRDGRRQCRACERLRRGTR